MKKHAVSIERQMSEDSKKNLLSLKNKLIAAEEKNNKVKREAIEKSRVVFTYSFVSAANVTNC